MKMKIGLHWVAFGCAVSLLLGPLGGRTMWEDGKTIITDSAGYNLVAVFSGIVAIVGLALADSVRARSGLLILGVTVAIVGFGLTAFVAGLYSLALVQGEVLVDGGRIMRDTADVHPASGPPFFVLAAVVGAMSTVAFAVRWSLAP